MSQFRFHERFRWPVDQVLLIGLGMVAPPVPVDNQVTVGGLPLPLPTLARPGRSAGDDREQGSGVRRGPVFSSRGPRGSGLSRPLLTRRNELNCAESGGQNRLAGGDGQECLSSCQFSKGTVP